MWDQTFHINKTLAIVCAEIGKAEENLREHIRIFYQNAGEEFITNLFYGQINYFLREASNEKRIENAFLKDLEDALSTAIAASVAIVAAVCAYFSYRLSKRIYDEIKSDEVIIPGPLHHPGLQMPEQNDCVLRCAVFNKSQRKAYINSVEAFDSKNSKIEITWSDGIDKIGDILNPTGLLGVTDCVNLFMRRIDGKEFDKTIVLIQHSFSSEKIKIVYDPYDEWDEDDGK